MVLSCNVLLEQLNRTCLTFTLTFQLMSGTGWKQISCNSRCSRDWTLCGVRPATSLRLVMIFCFKKDYPLFYRSLDTKRTSLERWSTQCMHSYVLKHRTFWSYGTLQIPTTVFMYIYIHVNNIRACRAREAPNGRPFGFKSIWKW